MFLLGIVCLVATGLFWVLVGAIVGATERRGLSTALLLILLAVGLLACSRFALWLQPDPELPRQAYLVGTLSFLGCGLFDYLMMLTMGRAMRNGPNGVVWTVTQSGVIFPFLFGVIFYSVPLNGLRVLGMVATLAALVCNGVAKGRASAAVGVPASPPAGGNWRLWMFLAFLCCGANQIFSNWPSYYPEVREGFSAYSRTLWMHYGYLGGFLLTENRRLFRRDYWRQLSDRRLWGLTALLLLANVIVGFWVCYRGVDLVTAHGLGAICYPVMVCSCLVGFPVYSTLVLRERCTALQWAALATGVVGIILVSLE